MEKGVRKSACVNFSAVDYVYRRFYLYEKCTKRTNFLCLFVQNALFRKNRKKCKKTLDFFLRLMYNRQALNTRQSRETQIAH